MESSTPLLHSIETKAYPVPEKWRAVSGTHIITAIWMNNKKCQTTTAPKPFCVPHRRLTFPAKIIASKYIGKSQNKMRPLAFDAPHKASTRLTKPFSKKGCGFGTIWNFPWSVSQVTNLCTVPVPSHIAAREAPGPDGLDAAHALPLGYGGGALVRKPARVDFSFVGRLKEGLRSADSI